MVTKAQRSFPLKPCTVLWQNALLATMMLSSLWAMALRLVLVVLVVALVGIFVFVLLVHSRLQTVEQSLRQVQQGQPEQVRMLVAVVPVVED
jgi:Tfp pilus assembly protein PilO